VRRFVAGELRHGACRRALVDVLVAEAEHVAGLVRGDVLGDLAFLPDRGGHVDPAELRVVAGIRLSGADPDRHRQAEVVHEAILDGGGPAHAEIAVVALRTRRRGPPGDADADVVDGHVEGPAGLAQLTEAVLEVEDVRLDGGVDLRAVVAEPRDLSDELCRPHPVRLRLVDVARVEFGGASRHRRA
jgi:hypothetical protein